MNLYLKLLNPLIISKNIFPLITQSPDTFSIYCELLVNNRNELISFLRSKGIDSRPLFRSLHNSSNDILNSSIFTYEEQKSAEKFDLKGISLPSGPSIKDSEIELVCKHIINFFSESNDK